MTATWLAAMYLSTAAGSRPVRKYPADVFIVGTASPSAAKPRRKGAVDRVHLEAVVRLEKGVPDGHAAEDQANDELNVGEAAVLISLARRPEKRRGRGFGGDDRRHHRPPRHATPAQREIVQR